MTEIMEKLEEITAKLETLQETVDGCYDLHCQTIDRITIMEAARTAQQLPSMLGGRR